MLCWYEDILNLTIMNLPPPMIKKNYSKIALTIYKAVKTVAESCMSDAAKGIKTINDDF